MFLINSITIVILFLLSLVLPITSFLLPVYKIKKMKNLSLKKNILVNILAMIIIALINPLLLIIYILFYLVIEIIYYYFIKILPNVKKFDRIIITSMIVSCFMGIFVYVFRDEFIKSMNIVMEVYKSDMKLTTSEVLELVTIIKNNSIYFLFYYTTLCMFFIYLSVDIKNYTSWGLSFEWLIIYIIPFFMIRLFKIDNLYIQNMMQIGEVIFTFYGIKSLFTFFSKYSKFTILNNLLAFIMAIVFPFGTFLIGVLDSFLYKNTDNN